jgi:hypothetical protein
MLKVLYCFISFSYLYEAQLALENILAFYIIAISLSSMDKILGEELLRGQI